MTAEGALILGLAAASLAIRLCGLLLGARLARSRHAWVLDALPGLIVVSLVGTALSGAGPVGWVAAGMALTASVLTRNVIAAMAAGMATVALAAVYGFSGI